MVTIVIDKHGGCRYSPASVALCIVYLIPQQPAGGPVRQGSRARGRWRECRTKRSRTKMASETIEIVRRTKKARKIGILRGRIRAGRNYLNPSEFPSDGPGQPIETFAMYCSQWRLFRRSCVAPSGHDRPLACAFRTAGGDSGDSARTGKQRRVWGHKG
jgi:hypothetical protein